MENGKDMISNKIMKFQFVTSPKSRISLSLHGKCKNSNTQKKPIASFLFIECPVVKRDGHNLSNDRSLSPHTFVLPAYTSAPSNFESLCWSVGLSLCTMGCRHTLWITRLYELFKSLWVTMLVSRFVPSFTPVDCRLKLGITHIHEFSKTMSLHSFYRSVVLFIYTKTTQKVVLE